MAKTKYAFSAEELGLLDAIHTEPRADRPRLVYTDWLEDNGQQEYAEFIRLQNERTHCVTSNMPMVPKAPSLEESRVVKKHRLAWSRPIPKGFQYVEFWRGLPRVFETLRQPSKPRPWTIG